MRNTVYSATTPDRHTYLQESAVMRYTHARWVLLPGAHHQKIVSWHLSKKGAAIDPTPNSDLLRDAPNGIVPAHACTHHYAHWHELGGRYDQTVSPEHYVRSILAREFGTDDMDAIATTYRAEINNRLPDGLILHGDAFLGDGSGRWGMHDIHAHLAAAELLTIAANHNTREGNTHA